MLHLNRGLLLEDTNELLSWGTDVEALRMIGNPDVKGSGTRVYFEWKNRRCLAGLRCCISALFLLGQNQRTLLQLSLTNFDIGREEFEEQLAAKSRIVTEQLWDGLRYDYLKERFVERFGVPLNLSDDEYYREEIEPRYQEEDIRNASWKHGDLSINLCWGYHDGVDKTIEASILTWDW